MNKEWFCIEIKGLYIGKILCFKQDLINDFNKKFLYNIQGNLIKVFGRI